jgi:hypothetical protein
LDVFDFVAIYAAFVTNRWLDDRGGDWSKLESSNFYVVRELKNMTNQPDNIEEKFRQLEREVQGDSGKYKAAEPLKRAEPSTERIDSPANSSVSIPGLFSWVNQQTGVTKLVAIAVLGIGGFIALSFLFKLVSFAISLAIFGVVVFILYKLFFEKSPSDPKV